MSLHCDIRKNQNAKLLSVAVSLQYKEQHNKSLNNENDIKAAIFFKGAFRLPLPITR